MQFISDKSHLKYHLYETAEALGICKKEKGKRVRLRLETLSNGAVGEVKRELEEEYARTSNDRPMRLIGYINRFYDALNYNEFREKGYPSGSGEEESAHRSVPQKWLKLPADCSVSRSKSFRAVTRQTRRAGEKPIRIRLRT
ncbi:hypothetical protein [Desulfonema magnum]|uniref:Uncharacterized protein n=1 Tax=Desulfonema magnum TaxID=45655 RepID=A0A975BUU2_9BACT|nr:hypothetical protein [Desulfonema magnum]QTA91907.1 Uncharacterized protein dnm_079800 [Desulfonema magnum]